MKRKKQKLSQEEKIDIILRPLSDEQIESLSAKELRILLRGEQQIRKICEEIIEQQRELNKQLQEKTICLEGVLVTLKCRLFSPKSERSKTNNDQPPPDKKLRKRALQKDRDLRTRYPDADVIEQIVDMEGCLCPHCNHEMMATDMYEQSQQLTVVPKKYLIKNILRRKHVCTHCHGTVMTAPVLPSITLRGAYSDEFLIDLALSKCCDLLPLERYVQMAARGGFNGLPANSLHRGFWNIANFLRRVYEMTRVETLDSLIMFGDETPHKMFEQEKNKSWYVWGFYGSTSCFFEYHDSRAGAIAGDVLSESGCEYFMSDAYSGYGAGIRDANELRKIAGLAQIVTLLCNAHARRYFNECISTDPQHKATSDDASVFVAEYKIIYDINTEVKKLLLEDKFDEAKKKRAELEKNFETMKEKATIDLDRYSSHHHYYKACQYYLNNYAGLTQCLKDPRLPLDNNLSERGLRPQVVGRKTWYGTHSENGAEALAIHFTLVESCKMNGVNPREYYSDIVDAIHYKKRLMTPFQYKMFKESTPDTSQLEKL